MEESLLRKKQNYIPKIKIGKFLKDGYSVTQIKKWK